MMPEVSKKFSYPIGVQSWKFEKNEKIDFFQMIFF